MTPRLRPCSTSLHPFATDGYCLVSQPFENSTIGTHRGQAAAQVHDEVVCAGLCCTLHCRAADGHASSGKRVHSHATARAAGEDFARTLTIPTLDFVTTHIYVRQRPRVYAAIVLSRHPPIAAFWNVAQPAVLPCCVMVLSRTHAGMLCTTRQCAREVTLSLAPVQPDHLGVPPSAFQWVNDNWLGELCT